MTTRVIVAMSGGVDSSVAAALLKDTGYEVIGIGLHLVEAHETDGHSRPCCGINDMDDARRVAEKIGIPFYVLNYTDRFNKTVIDYFVTSYLKGETPNPCIPCNAVIKFDELLQTAQGLGAEKVATGHYAILKYDTIQNRYILKRGVDNSKDQSYFLYPLTQEQFSHALFPMGDLEKSETRRIAKALGLKVHDKTESQDICFVDKRGYGAFISQFTGAQEKPGPILNEDGSRIGTHKGLYHYTIGQRRGLGVSFPEPMYVVDINSGENSITVATADRLSSQNRLFLDNMNYISIGVPDKPLEASCVTRYRKPEAQAMLTPIDNNRAFIEFTDPQEPTAAGQSVVIYKDGEVLCGGIARKGGSSESE